MLKYNSPLYFNMNLIHPIILLIVSKQKLYRTSFSLFIYIAHFTISRNILSLFRSEEDQSLNEDEVKKLKSVADEKKAKYNKAR